LKPKKTEKVVPSFFDFFDDGDKEMASCGDDGAFIKDDLLPNSLEYYLNILDENEDFGDEEGEDGEDDEEEEETKEAKQKKTKKGGAAGTAGGKDEKCKNQ